MCLIIAAIDQHPDYKLIIAANRDEFYARPTEPAHFWKEHPDMLAGKDLKEGGTWMGITKQGKIAAVTNFRSGIGEAKNVFSRGLLVKNYLLNNYGAEEYLKEIRDNAGSYNGFNLLAGNQDEIFYYSNKGEKIKKLEKGVHGLSNNFIDVPWPKVVRSKEKLSQLISENKIGVDALFEIMNDRKTADKKDLPSTGIPKTLEEVLSPIFIKALAYGTRSSTLLLIDRNNNVRFIERNFNNGEEGETKEYSFEIMP